MFKYLFKSAVAAVAVRLLDNYRQLSLQLLKIEAAKGYVHGVRMARLSAIGLIRMALLIVLIGMGLLLLHAGLFFLLPWSVETKAMLGMCLGLAYAIGGSALLVAAMRERRWMEKSGASKMVQDATGMSEKVTEEQE
ncbi:MAG: hypothetical protein ACOYOU_01885 [Kiritimatiellia bacterium]